jgi:hypothetical protein
LEFNVAPTPRQPQPQRHSNHPSLDNQTNHNSNNSYFNNPSLNDRNLQKHQANFSFGRGQGLTLAHFPAQPKHSLWDTLGA